MLAATMCVLTVASATACSSSSAPAPTSAAAGESAAAKTETAAESKAEQAAPSGAVEYSFAVHHSGAASHPYQQGSEFWNEKLKEYSNGTMELDIFIGQLQKFGKTSTQIVFSTHVRPRGVDVEE